MALKLRKNKSPVPLCPIGACMKFLRGAWTPNVVWYLIGGPRRFSELRTDIPGVSAKVLSARLKELEAIGILDRTVQPTSPPSVEYSLTDLGRELVPAIEAIASVGQRLRNGHDAPRGHRASAKRASMAPGDARPHRPRAI
jgi:DNA-binding HxlR family transcriptional regulator